MEGLKCLAQVKKSCNIFEEKALLVLIDESVLPNQLIVLQQEIKCRL